MSSEHNTISLVQIAESWQNNFKIPKALTEGINKAIIGSSLFKELFKVGSNRRCTES